MPPEVTLQPEVTPQTPGSDLATGSDFTTGSQLLTSPQTHGSDLTTGSDCATGSENPSTVLLYNGITGLYICVACCRLRLVVMLWGDLNQRMRVE